MRELWTCEGLNKWREEGRQSGGRGSFIRREEVIKESFTIRIRDKG